MKVMIEFTAVLPLNQLAWQQVGYWLASLEGKQPAGFGPSEQEAVQPEREMKAKPLHFGAVTLMKDTHLSGSDQVLPPTDADLQVHEPPIEDSVREISPAPADTAAVSTAGSVAANAAPAKRGRKPSAKLTAEPPVEVTTAASALAPEYPQASAMNATPAVVLASPAFPVMPAGVVNQSPAMPAMPQMPATPSMPAMQPQTPAMPQAATVSGATATGEISTQQLRELCTQVQLTHRTLPFQVMRATSWRDGSVKNWSVMSLDGIPANERQRFLDELSEYMAA